MECDELVWIGSKIMLKGGNALYRYMNVCVVGLRRGATAQQATEL
jgi:hypothetical protein